MTEKLDSCHLGFTYYLTKKKKLLPSPFLTLEAMVGINSSLLSLSEKYIFINRYGILL